VNLADEHVPGRRQGVAAGNHVLVVDDEPVVRRLVARLLEAEGFTVHEASDGAEALDRVRADGDLFDVIVSDIVMPRMNGVELLQTLSTFCPQLPVILISGYGAAELAERGIAAPCAVLAKPLVPELLLAEVRRCLRHRV
jgi:two-component system cell cycle sensor histidine kinase/response regulator CckA